MIHNKKKHICVAVAAVQFLALSKAMCKKLSAQQSNLLSILVLSIAMCKFSAQQSLAEQSHVQLYYDERTRLSELSKKSPKLFKTSRYKQTVQS